MVFEKFRSRVKSFSKSKSNSKPDWTSKSIKSGSTHDDTFTSSIPEVIVTPPKVVSGKTESAQVNEESASDSKDFEEFLEKARKDAEKAERKKIKEIREARERNMSPWAGRM